MISSEEALRDLLLMGLAGDDDTYHLFLKRLSMHLRAYFRRRLSGFPDEVEDLLQESLLAIHDKRHTYDAAQPLTAWAHAIARHKLVDLLRRRGMRECLHVPLDEESALLIEAQDDAGSARHDVMSLLAQLPERQRLLIRHMKLDGLSVQETARLTGMSESAVKVSVHRGLKALAARMRNQP